MHSAVERALWSVAVLAAGAAAYVLTAPTAVLAIGAPSHATVSRHAPAEVGHLSRLAAELVATNPFRLTRRPSDPAAAPAPETPDLSAPSAPPKPVLILTGLIGGPPWEALVEGIPGRNGSVLLREGEQAGEFTAVRIAPDTVVIAGADTVYALLPRRPWN